jgi:hypothetical protein
MDKLTFERKVQESPILPSKATSSPTRMASVFIGNVGPELTIRDNKIESVGNYAVDSNAEAVLQNNFCTAPFQVAGLPSNAFDQGCSDLRARALRESLHKATGLTR